MKVEAQADTESEARSLVGQVRATVSAGKVSADGPRTEGNRGWSVSYEIFAPHSVSLDLSTRNGGVHLSDLRGNIHFAAVNGGVHMARVDGNVTGQTTNGGPAHRTRRFALGRAGNGRQHHQRRRSPGDARRLFGGSWKLPP